MNERLDQQMRFLYEVDRLKSVLRATTLCDGSRHENSGEHSWHLALYAWVLGEHSEAEIDISRVIRMLLIHDIVEVDAGDKPLFGEHDEAEIAAEEDRAAERIFGLLPADQRASLRALWEEFEAAESNDAVFAKSLDRFQPPNQNLASGGGSWKDFDVNVEKIEARVGSRVRRGAPALWAWIRPKIDGYFAANPGS
ncbi:MAG: putative hydrolase of HD superfamily [Planctomycetota bacterium]|jgi:putative hydrolase of HD superfamily